ncbi:MAG: YchJ family metal-binding protein [Methylotenera sp.]
MTLCPCESGKPYSKCCEVYHLGTPAPTAEALMRSRYSAYALATENPALTKYLLQTWHPDTRPESLSLTGEDAIKWLGLQVKHHQKIDANNAIVEFVARYKYASNLGAKAERLHETSRFKLIDNRWYYLDGDYR